MRLSILLAFIFFFCLSANGQSILVNEDPAITSMMQKYVMQSQEKDMIKAWRIQIITTDDRRRMENAEAKFRRMYPDFEIIKVHESPYYRIKTGAWENKLDLQVFLQSIKGDFPSAIPVLDDIPESSLLRI